MCSTIVLVRIRRHNKSPRHCNALLHTLLTRHHATTRTNLSPEHAKHMHKVHQPDPHPDPHSEPNDSLLPKDVRMRIHVIRKSGHVREQAPEQRVAASTFCRYSRCLHLAISLADAWPIPISLKCQSTCCNHKAHGQAIGLLYPHGSLVERI